MKGHAEDEGRWAVARGDLGDLVTMVPVALGRSRDRVNTWLTRARSGDPAWAQDGRIGRRSCPGVVRFRTDEVAARVRPPTPDWGCSLLVRFIWTDRRPDMFGELFLLWPEGE